ncbi:hypothetical protein FDG2_0525 [Candidatus Protofrankia californiensis]|uniref:Uncharacterized protein n=1 Tax=Candidatus Protofrankia californiensis TaxID=1839754 RepID=A0A1C3NTT6_9ACTN|nr:hypothetical protein FDG2_0525 [Candidatus Protofrankia californiensis]
MTASRSVQAPETTVEDVSTGRFTIKIGWSGQMQQCPTTDGARTARSNSNRPDYPIAHVTTERIKRRLVLGGLVNAYERAAYKPRSTSVVEF